MLSCAATKKMCIGVQTDMRQQIASLYFFATRILFAYFSLLNFFLFMSKILLIVF
jgi:hypothetical protein